MAPTINYNKNQQPMVLSLPKKCYITTKMIKKKQLGFLAGTCCFFVVCGSFSYNWQFIKDYTKQVKRHHHHIQHVATNNASYYKWCGGAGAGHALHEQQQQQQQHKATGMIQFVQDQEKNRNIPHLQGLQDADMCRSLRHQQKFFSIKDQVLSWVRNHSKHHHLLLYSTSSYFILNVDYAFLHIYKNGGTTVQKQLHSPVHTKNGHHSRSQVGNTRRLVTTVRDPLDHFLSGWIECASRRFGGLWRNTSQPYDDRIRDWLSLTKICRESNQACYCYRHSWPQANFLLSNTNTGTAHNPTKIEIEINPQLDIVGDLKELPALLEFVGFSYNASIATGRNATLNQLTNTHFRKEKDLLSNSTLVNLCKFLALDYYLFDFQPPAVCRDEIFSEMAKMMASPIF